MEIQDFVFSIGKIVDGAANGDYAKVASYVQHLSAQLEASGDKLSAKRLIDILDRSKARRFIPANAGNASFSHSQHDVIPVDSEFRMPMATEQYPPADDVPLYLAAETSSIIQQFLRYCKAADRLAAHGVGLSSTMLLYGPPGCGKTQVAKYISKELKLPLVTARMDGIISSYLGSTAKNLRLVFEHFGSRPCVLFLDEFDAVGKLRDDANELGELKRVVISLLQNMDALDSDHILIAATNHEHLLDSALWRRFTYKILLTAPDLPARKAILANTLTKYASDDTIDALAAVSEGHSGAQLVQIAQEALRDYVLRDARSLSFTDCLEAGRRVGALSLKSETVTLRDQVCTMHKIDPKRFSGLRLAKLFGIPPATAYRMLREDEGDRG